MNGVCLNVYVTEFSEHRGLLVYEWLVEEAKRLGVPGVSVFRAIAGFGRHGQMHEESFFELAADLPIMVSFVLPEELARKVLDTIAENNLKLFYVTYPAEFGFAGDGAPESASAP